MLMLLSPAKNMNFDPAAPNLKASKPQFSKDTAELSGVTKTLTRARLKSLMKISDNLADLNYERFQAFKSSGKPTSAKQAALAFNGDVYLGLEASSLSEKDLDFAQDHIAILSGLYGLLRPLDSIQPYRLEMGSRLNNPRGENLYDFWGDKIAKKINTMTKSHDDPTVVNLASNEYFSAVDKTVLSPALSPRCSRKKKTVSSASCNFSPNEPAAPWPAGRCKSAFQTLTISKNSMSTGINFRRTNRRPMSGSLRGHNRRRKNEPTYGAFYYIFVTLS